MISDKMRDAINVQQNAELYSAYLYLSMAAYFESGGLKGFAGWMKAQAQEEVMHAMKFYNYLALQGARIKMLPIEGPQTEWGSPVGVFEYTLKHEQKVTALINGLVDLAKSEKDEASDSFLQWFVKEQIEEEESAGKALQKTRDAGGDPQVLASVGDELGRRRSVFSK